MEQNYPQGQPQFTGVAPEQPDNYQLPPNVTIDKLPMGGENQEGGMPSAPVFEPVQGYGTVSFNDAFLPPPSYDTSIYLTEPPNRPGFHAMPLISEAEARQALLEHCNKHCCYGKGAATNMAVAKLESSSAFHYILESFGEARATAWASTPFRARMLIPVPGPSLSNQGTLVPGYAMPPTAVPVVNNLITGGPVDGPMNGPAPLPWEIPAFAAVKFKDEKRRIEVPHTAYVKSCHKCYAMGRVRCHHCYGRGNVDCSSCTGGYTTINNQRTACSFCNGSGRRDCSWCYGHGHVRCPECQGACQLKWFIQLTVTWTNHLEDYILERTAMPDEKIRKVQGQLVFEEEGLWVYPVTQCPEFTVNKASSDLVGKHRVQFPSERILLQRHKIRVVPVTEVNANWKDKHFTFYVYGLEHKVYSDNYPQTCCCGCTVL